MDDVMVWRRTQRIELIARRMAIEAPRRDAWNAAIADHLRGVLQKRPSATLGFYWPIRGEFDPRPVVFALIAQGWRGALPVVVGKDRPLEFRAWTHATKMERGVLNIMIPSEGAPVRPDIVLAPLVGYDDARYRLGNGGGYFDRTLAALTPAPLAIGIGYAFCRLATIYPQPHDWPMDTIVTEQGVVA